jgi:glutamate/tyrosine decarboxylase-like PLP-dependent enzyme
MFYTKHIDMCSEVFGGVKAAYLDTGKTSIPQPLSVGIENSRRFRALPLYMSLLTYGAKGYQEVFENNCKFAVRLGDWIDQHPDLELLAPVYLHTVLFRVSAKQWSHPEGNDEYIEAVKGTEKVYVTKTVWDGQLAIRAAMSNWRTDLDRDLPIVQQALEEALQTRTK